MRGPIRLAFYVALGCAALAGPSAAGAAPTTLYTSPTGSGSTCSSGSPCAIATAFSNAAAGDTISVGSGTYTGLGFLTNTNGVHVVGAATRPVLSFDSGGLQVTQAGSSIRHLRVS